MAFVVVGLLCLVGAVIGAPVKTFDQRQQGELNIHAQLDNIVVVVIPSAKLNLLQLASNTKYSGEKGGFFQALQKLHKDIEKYEASNDEDSSSDSQNDIKYELAIPDIMSQQVLFSQEEKKEEKKGENNEDKEEEVVAKVEEMKPETTDNLEVPKEDKSDVKEPASLGEPVKDSVLTVTIPIEIKDEVKKVEDKSQEPSTLNASDKIFETEEKLIPQTEVSSEENKGGEDISSEKSESSDKETAIPLKEEGSSEKVTAPKGVSSESSESGSSESSSVESPNPTLEELVKPVSVKEENTPHSSFLKKDTEEPTLPALKKTSEPARLQESTRKEKLIRYKPETKWAPELVDLLGPSRRSKELQERQRFSNLCSPGVWDIQLKTCIMPGESRSRSDLGRFLQAMRFGLVLPTK